METSNSVSFRLGRAEMISYFRRSFMAAVVICATGIMFSQTPAPSRLSLQQAASIALVKIPVR